MTQQTTEATWSYYCTTIICAIVLHCYQSSRQQTIIKLSETCQPATFLSWANEEASYPTHPQLQWWASSVKCISDFKLYECDKNQQVSWKLTDKYHILEYSLWEGAQTSTCTSLTLPHPLESNGNYLHSQTKSTPSKNCTRCSLQEYFYKISTY